MHGKLMAVSNTQIWKYSFLKVWTVTVLGVRSSQVIETTAGNTGIAAC